MSAKKISHLDKILGRLDDLDSVNLTILVQRLARERQLLETVFNAIQEGVIVITRTGLIEYSNASANRIIGLKEKDVGQSVLWKVMPDLTRTLNFVVDPNAKVLPVISREIEISYPEHRFVRLYMVPFEGESEDEDTRRYAILMSDVTEDKISTEELIVNERLSSIFDLAAGVAHEIGNPLNSINIHLQLIQRRLSKLEEVKGVEKIGESIEACVGEVQRLDGIITHFLNALRPQPMDLQDVQLLDVLTEVLLVQGEELKGLGIEVEVDIKEALPIVIADRNQVKQVFFNIIKNAMEAMDAGGRLTITTRNDDLDVFIFMADTGVGIEQEDLAKVFQPYASSKSDGHGLGMMIVQRILRDHGGQIGIDSQAGKGTLVTLQFPQKHRRVRMIQSSDETMT